jgi:hypothetical protein
MGSPRSQKGQFLPLCWHTLGSPTLSPVSFDQPVAQRSPAPGLAIGRVVQRLHQETSRSFIGIRHMVVRRAPYGR